jgi:hypothetical protein
VSERADTRTRALLAEAAGIATVELPQMTARARDLAARWFDEQVLDPEAALDTLRALQDEVSSIEPRIMQLRARQNEIAAELRRLLEEARDP